MYYISYCRRNVNTYYEIWRFSQIQKVHFMQNASIFIVWIGLPAKNRFGQQKIPQIQSMRSITARLFCGILFDF